MLELTDLTFEAPLQSGKYLLMFYTTWCPLCPVIISILTELERTEGGKFIFAKIDHDENKQAAEYYGAFGVPLVLAVVDGRPAYGIAGILIPEVYRMMVEELLYDFDEARLDEKIKRIEAFTDSILLGPEGEK